MARSLWSGSLSFGLVNVPVTMLTAVRDLDLHFRQLHASDGAPIEVQRWCSEEKREVPYEEITRSYELEDGGTVIVTDDDLEAVEPRRTRTIEIEQFVDLAEVDPVLLDHPYYLAPASGDDGGLRAYRLLVEVMQRTERAAVGRLVMRTKQYLALVRARDGALALSTMRFADELRPTSGVDAPHGKDHKPTKKQLDAAVAVIEEMAAPWEPERYEDCYRARLEAVIACKRRGETVTAPATETAPEAAPDLMAALERTLAELSSEKPRETQKA